MRIAYRFIADDRGVVTIEFVSLVFFFMLFFAFFVDVCMVYLTYNDMYTVARDVSRRISTDQFETMQEIRDYTAERLLSFGITYSLAVDLTKIEREVIITANVYESALFGSLLHQFIGTTMSARASTRREPIW